MKPIHASLIAATCFCSLTSCTQDATAQSPCPVAGRYAVAGELPGEAGSYAGETLISASEAGCDMRWYPPNDSSGSGTYSDGVLTIRFTFADGRTGQVHYTRATNGELQGLWWMDGDDGNQGTETLSPL